jgi:hydrogenase-4 component F
VTEALVLATVAAPLFGALATALPTTPRTTARANAAAALLTAALATALALVALLDADAGGGATWFVADAASGVFLLVIAAIGLLSALCLPRHLAGPVGGVLGRRDLHRPVYVAFHLFWGMLIALPLVANLAVAWLVVEATTAASALLVAATGRRGALEAGWKYLLLTTCGLTIALVGIVILFAALSDGVGTPATLDWSAIRAGAHALDDGTATVAAVLILVGLAAKIGWAPVHNWLPDAHSEAPPPVSALLSAALLPTVMLVAWRTRTALAPSGADEALTTLFLGFGLVSLAVAVPFLWRPMGLKRLLAYSSLEHMGVLALGIGFATPLAIAGVVVHLAGHALAKALGFYAATPLLGHDPRASRRAIGGVGRSRPALGAAMGISLGALSGLPPSPLFVSEVMIVAGGFAAGRAWVAGIAAVLLGLGFLGLVHALLETTAGRSRRRGAVAPGLRGVSIATVAAGVMLLALAGAAPWLPGSEIVKALVRGLA